jgi:hypothetical protein
MTEDQKESPMVVRLDVAANIGTPALAGMIACLLTKAGATVTLGDPRIDQVSEVKSLEGLHVHIDRLTWVRNEEAERWTKNP